MSSPRTQGPLSESMLSASSQVLCSSENPSHHILNWNQFQNHWASMYFSITQKSSSLTLTGGGTGCQCWGIMLGFASNKTFTWKTSWILQCMGYNMDILQEHTPTYKYQEENSGTHLVPKCIILLPEAVSLCSDLYIKFSLFHAM